MKFIIIGMKKLCSRTEGWPGLAILIESLLMANKDFRHGGLLLVNSFILKFPIHSLPDLHWATVASTASTNLKDLDTSAPGVCVPTMHLVVVGACWA
ncbi:hypothetical protein H5410_041229 [Solanum commersonii]|uniref:Uncharacterized protein n=1 Tax=Solanum commersonii TaxID=4109 RepID=A0A9J5XQZ6_SOLCO|nr:hypothetical protein H5410_041229 [Solanum commersonii]